MKVEMFIPGWSWLQSRFPSPILGPNTRENPRFKCGDARETDCKNALKFGLADYDQVNPHQLAPVSNRHVESTIFHWFFLEVHSRWTVRRLGPRFDNCQCTKKLNLLDPGVCTSCFFLVLNVCCCFLFMMLRERVSGFFQRSRLSWPSSKDELIHNRGDSVAEPTKSIYNGSYKVVRR